jgi:hypothetical protein
MVNVMAIIYISPGFIPLTASSINPGNRYLPATPHIINVGNHIKNPLT